MVKLDILRSQSISLGVFEIAKNVLDKPEFLTCSGSHTVGMHHYGTGGLLQHTLEVWLLADKSNFVLNEPVSRKELFLACLFHDIGKIYDYELVNGVWGPTQHKYLIRHLSRSAIEWSKAVDQHKDYQNMHDSVLHAILAHHGSKLHGSPVTPRTQLAWLLHLSDALSARMNDYDFFSNRFDG